MPNLGPTEWIIIGVLLVILFGSKKLTEFARGLGESGKELKKAKREFQDTFHESKKEDKPEKND